jgi:hypothetical protein
MDKEDIQKILQYLKLAEEFRPLVDEAKKLLKTYGTDIGEIFEDILKWTAKNNLKILEYYKQNGLSHEDAMTLLVDHKIGIQRIAQRSNKK